MAVRSTNEAEIIDPGMLKFIEAAHNMRKKTTDTELINALHVILSQNGPSYSN